MNSLLRSIAVAGVLTLATAMPAAADATFVYWSYWQGDTGAWSYAQLGPASIPAKDGGIDGWRFGTGATALRTTAPPTGAADFPGICGNTPPIKGKSRIAITIDYGSDAAAPPARTACAVVDEGLPRMAALTTVAQLRLDNGFVCAIDGYPAQGCAEVSTTPADPGLPTTAAALNAKQPPAATRTAAGPVTAPPAVTATAASTGDAVDETATTTDAPVDADRPWLPTVVTLILGSVALLLAIRNARLQQERHR